MSDAWAIAMLICFAVYLVAWRMGLRYGYQRALDHLIAHALDAPLEDARQSEREGAETRLVLGKISIGVFGQNSAEIIVAESRDYDRDDI